MASQFPFFPSCYVPSSLERESDLAYHASKHNGDKSYSNKWTRNRLFWFMTYWEFKQETLVHLKLSENGFLRCLCLCATNFANSELQKVLMTVCGSKCEVGECMCACSSENQDAKAENKMPSHSLPSILTAPSQLSLLLSTCLHVSGVQSTCKSLDPSTLITILNPNVCEEPLPALQEGC